jgi:hypothetical protein
MWRRSTAAVHERVGRPHRNQPCRPHWRQERLHRAESSHEQIDCRIDDRKDCITRNRLTNNNRIQMKPVNCWPSRVAGFILSWPHPSWTSLMSVFITPFPRVNNIAGQNKSKVQSENSDSSLRTIEKLSNDSKVPDLCFTDFISLGRIKRNRWLEGGVSMWGHSVGWIPRECVGPSAFGAGPSHCTWALGK